MYGDENLGLTAAALKTLFVEKEGTERVTKMEVSPNTVEPKEIGSQQSQESKVF